MDIDRSVRPKMRDLVGVTAGLIASGLIINACRTNTSRAAESHQRTRQQVERGRYLVSIIGCGGCHTPTTEGPHGSQVDASRLLSGHPENVTLPDPPPSNGPWGVSGALISTAFAGPWGISFTANLTPDRNTGLGIWTEEMFINAMRTGRHMGVSRPILPPMPWSSFGRMSDDDLKAVFAYLRTLPPVANHVPEPIAPKVVQRQDGD